MVMIAIRAYACIQASALTVTGTKVVSIIVRALACIQASGLTFTGSTL